MSLFQSTNFCIKVFVAICFLFFCANAFSGYRYPEKAHDLALKIIDELVYKGVCLKKNHCYGKQFITVSGSEESSYINIFRSNELGADLLSLIIHLCVEDYYIRDKKVSLFLKIYRETIGERNRLFSGVKPFIEMEMKGEK